MFKLGVIIMALSASLFGNWFTNLFDRTPIPPLHSPIDLSTAGSVVETEVRVEEDGWYDFMIDIPYENGKVIKGVKDVMLVRKIIGYNRYNPRTGEQLRSLDYDYIYEKFKKQGILIDKEYTADGVIIPIRLIINNQKNIILDKVYQSKGYGNTKSYRTIIEMQLKKGKYNMRLENIKSIVEMKDRKANIRFGRAYHGK